MSEQIEDVIITTPTQVINEFLGTDSRWGGVWMKEVTDVDLSQQGGYALLGKFLNRHEAYAFYPNRWYVLHSITGSHRHHYPNTDLIRSTKHGFVEILNTGRLVQYFYKQKLITTDQYVQSRNNILYQYAIVIKFLKFP